jgi:hypothetical protein
MRKVIKSVVDGKPGGTRIYDTPEQRKQAIDEMIKNGINYFVVFKDVNGCGLQYGKVDWLPEGRIYRC